MRASAKLLAAVGVGDRRYKEANGDRDENQVGHGHALGVARVKTAGEVDWAPHLAPGT